MNIHQRQLAMIELVLKQSLPSIRLSWQPSALIENMSQNLPKISGAQNVKIVKRLEKP